MGARRDLGLAQTRRMWFSPLDGHENLADHRCRVRKAPAQHTTRSLCNCAVMAIGTGARIYVPAKCLKQPA